jgi:hypothetical protein
MPAQHSDAAIEERARNRLGEIADCVRKASRTGLPATSSLTNVFLSWSNKTADDSSFIFQELIEDCALRCPILQLPLSTDVKSCLRPVRMPRCACLVAHGTADLSHTLRYCLLCKRSLGDDEPAPPGTPRPHVAQALSIETCEAVCEAVRRFPVNEETLLHRPSAWSAKLPPSPSAMLSSIVSYSVIGASCVQRTQGKLQLLNSLCMQQLAASQCCSIAAVSSVRWGKRAAEVTTATGRETLQDWLRGSSAACASDAEVVRQQLPSLFQKAAQAVQTLHSLQLLHLGIDPNCIMRVVDRSGVMVWQLAGLSVACLYGETAPSRGPACPFLAPEQLRGEACRASDVYALAHVMAFAASGGHAVDTRGSALLAAMTALRAEERPNAANIVYQLKAPSAALIGGLPDIQQVRSKLLFLL